jgi:hypothetical protein
MEAQPRRQRRAIGGFLSRADVLAWPASIPAGIGVTTDRLDVFDWPPASAPRTLTWASWVDRGRTVPA